MFYCPMVWFSIIIHLIFILFILRARFEPRWFAALRKFNIPVQLCWGDSDAVSPLGIPLHIRDNVLPRTTSTYNTLNGVGHFLMLESPDEWSKMVAEFIQLKQWLNVCKIFKISFSTSLLHFQGFAIQTSCILKSKKIAINCFSGM